MVLVRVQKRAIYLYIIILTYFVVTNLLVAVLWFLEETQVYSLFIYFYIYLFKIKAKAPKEQAPKE